MSSASAASDTLVEGPGSSSSGEGVPKSLRRLTNDGGAVGNAAVTDSESCAALEPGGVATAPRPYEVVDEVDGAMNGMPSSIESVALERVPADTNDCAPREA